MRTSINAVFMLLIAGSAAIAEPDPTEVRSGPWRAWLDSPGGELPFGLELQRDGETYKAVLINGRERITVPSVGFRDGKFVIDIEHYDSTLTATVDAGGARLDGEWTKTATGGKQARLPFHAVAGESPRFPQLALTSPDALRRIEGRWSVTFSGDDEPAVADFVTKLDGVVEGTIMTATGDYGYLAGLFEQNRLRLSNFDGAHAFLFDARLKEDGTLAGEFWSRDTFHVTWTAKRDSSASLSGELAAADIAGAIPFASLTFPDVDGREWSLGHERFSGKGYIIEIFGSWCPNCTDEAATLADLHRRYRDKGLSVIGLAFELTGDAKRDARLVRKYVERHKIEYPVLVAGVADKARAAEALPFIKNLKGYPTTIFTDAAGNVRASHVGFSGPATGEEHHRLRRKFDAIVRQILDLADESNP